MAEPERPGLAVEAPGPTHPRSSGAGRPPAAGGALGRHL